MTFVAAGVLAFVSVFTLIVGLWWVYQSGEQLRRRLGRHVDVHSPENQLLRSDVATSQSGWERLVRRSDLVGQLTQLARQAGSKRSASELVLILAAVATLGGLVGGWRIGSAGGALISALITGSLPVLWLLHKGHQRRQRFQEHFADAVDMISRSIRAGNALSAAIQLVGEEMADPIGDEFRQVTEEIRLGLDPGEALLRLGQRVPTEDVKFFCTAILIQRGSGGNLAEIL